ncbi:hypothetical protein MRX96_021357 [Rhipicephalus microplus]
MRLIHAFEGTDDELLDQVRRKCFGDFYPPASQAAYPMPLMSFPFPLQRYLADPHRAAPGSQLTLGLFRA